MGDTQWPVALELTETRLLEGLGVRRSPGCESMAAAAPAEQRASREMARSGLGDLEYCMGREGEVQGVAD